MVKKIAHERLTSLVFREECIVTACQDGYVCTWARPGRGVRTNSKGLYRVDQKKCITFTNKNFRHFVFRNY